MKWRDLTLEEVIAGINEAYESGITAGRLRGLEHGLSCREIDEGMRPYVEKLGKWRDDAIATVKRQAEQGTWRIQ